MAGTAGQWRRTAREIHRSAGAKRRISAGRWRFPGTAVRLRSSMATRSFSSRRSGPIAHLTRPPVPRAVPQPVGPEWPAAATSAGSDPQCISSWFSASTAKLAKCAGSTPPPSKFHIAGHHRDHGYASGSPTTDGHRLYASFGSQGVFCYDLEGNPQWSRDLGKMESTPTTARPSRQLCIKTRLSSCTTTSGNRRFSPWMPAPARPNGNATATNMRAGPRP